MSSAVSSTSAALSRPFLFDADAEPQVDCHPERSGTCAKRISRGVEGYLPDPRLASVLPASRLAIRPTPEMASSGIPELDALTGGLPRGCLTEICGPASSGRTSLLLASLAAATHRGEYCAVIDASDSLDPQSVAAAGVNLDRLLWVRCGDSSPRRHGDTEKSNTKESPRYSPIRHSGGCPTLRDFRRVGTSSIEFNSKYKKKANSSSGESEHRLEQVLRATDLLLESGGFGLIILDLADVPPQEARRIPLTTWFRFRRTVEHKPTILLAIEQQPIAGSCSSLLLKLGAPTKEEEKTGESIPLSRERSSRKAALWESPARQCRVVTERSTESRRDDTVTDSDNNAHNIAHPTHASLLEGLNIRTELVRSRIDRKPAHSIAFETKTAWAG